MEGEEEEAAAEWTELDPERFLAPRDSAKLIPSDQPVAHDGKEGWAVERATGRARWLSGSPQTEVMMRQPGAIRDEPGLTDFPVQGGLPDPAPATAELRATAAESRRKRVQIGLKLTPVQATELDDAAAALGITRTTLARVLVVRGAREIVARAKD